MDFGGFFKGNKSQKSDQGIQSGAIPAVQQDMTATRNATYAFSGVGRHISTSFRRLGKKATEAGLGRGIGAGNAFGLDFAVKRGMSQRVHVFLVQAMANMMKSAGIIPNFPGLPAGRLDVTSELLRRGVSTIGEGRNLESDLKSFAFKATPPELLGRLEKFTNSSKKTKLDESAQSFQSENDILQMLINHQRIIEELKKETANLRRVLEEDFKVARSKLQLVDETTKSMNSSSDCFDCRRRNRRFGR